TTAASSRPTWPPDAFLAKVRTGLYFVFESVDSVDRTILRTLMVDGRATWADLAVELGLTAPAIAQRVRRLQDRGLIRQFAALVAPDQFAPISAFVSVALTSPDAHVAFQH